MGEADEEADNYCPDVIAQHVIGAEGTGAAWQGSQGAGGWVGLTLFPRPELRLEDHVGAAGVKKGGGGVPHSVRHFPSSILAVDTFATSLFAANIFTV